MGPNLALRNARLDARLSQEDLARRIREAGYRGGDPNGQVVTGTWTEHTSPDGYYRGAVYHGAIQMLADPTGRRMTGKWAGFGRDLEVNTGPWTLELVTESVTAQAMREHDKRIEPPS